VFLRGGLEDVAGTYARPGKHNQGEGQGQGGVF
jgi:hypothetical protein